MAMGEEQIWIVFHVTMKRRIVNLKGSNLMESTGREFVKVIAPKNQIGVTLCGYLTNAWPSWHLHECREDSRGTMDTFEGA